MHKVSKALLLFSFSFLLIFNSCTNLFENSVDNQNQNTQTADSAGQTPAAAAISKFTFGGSLRVEGALPSALQQALTNPNEAEIAPLVTDDSRSARPSISTGTNYEYYVRAYTDDGAQPQETNPQLVDGVYSYSLELELEHTWKFEAGFRRKAIGTQGEAGYQPARQLLIDYDSKRNTPYSLDLHTATGSFGEEGHVFFLSPVQSENGKGSINLEINIEDTAADSCVLKVADTNGVAVNWDGNGKVSIVKPDSSTWYIRSEGVNTSNSELNVHSVKSGSYELTLMFYKNYEISGVNVPMPVFTSYQTINVFDNMTTDTWLNEAAGADANSLINPSTGVFKVTAALVNQAIQTTLYVGVPDTVHSLIPVLNPSDQNEDYVGAPFAPLATLTGAFRKIQAQGTGGNYKIYVSGTQTGHFSIPADLNTKASSIEITTADGNASPAVLNGGNNGTVLTVVSSVPLTISNLIITGGHAENGGGLYLNTNANVILGNGAVIGAVKNAANGDTAANSASACANFASTAGAGIYCKGTLTLKSGSLVSYNYVADDDADQQGGGGIYCEGGTVNFQNGSKVCFNGAQTQGGGICLYSGTVNMTAGELSNNIRNAVCIRGTLTDGVTYAFNLGGSAKIPCETGEGVDNVQKNDINLPEGKFVTLKSNLTQHDQEHPIALNTTNFTRGTQVIKLTSTNSNTNTSLINANKNKFRINDDPEWIVVNTANDYGQQGFIDTEYIYVGSSNPVANSGISAPPSNASERRGTKAKPYASITEASKQCYTYKDFTIRISGKIGSASAREFIGSDTTANKITIEGTNGDNTKDIIDRGLTEAIDDGSALVVSSGAHINVDGILIKNLKITGGYTTGNGGGILLEKQCSLTLEEGALICGNNAEGSGGGIYYDAGHTGTNLVMLSGSEISGNTAGNNGGGLYIKYANFYMSGTALIGQKVSGTSNATKSAYFTDEEHKAYSNYAGKIGGGVYCDEYTTVYLGYATDNTTTTGYELATDAGILFNYSVDNGGGISAANVNSLNVIYMASGNISNNGCSSTKWGGGIYLGKGFQYAKLDMTGGKIDYNHAGNGGGVYLNTKGALLMSGGSMSGNTVDSTSGKGGAVYVNEDNSSYSNYGFQIQDDANLYTSSNAEKVNDVYLASGKVIAITGNLSNDHVATLTPGATTWQRGTTQVIKKSSYTEANYNKFNISDPDWKIEKSAVNSEYKGVIDADIWVSSSAETDSTRASDVGRGNDSNRGTKSKPYATISKAVSQCWDRTKDFIINVDGKVTGAQVIGASSGNAGTITAKTLTIQGYIPQGQTSSTATLDNELVNGKITLTVNVTTKSDSTTSFTEYIKIKNLKITGGKGSDGGGIYLKRGGLHLTDGVVITGNQSANGAGVYIDSNGYLFMYGKALIGDSITQTATGSEITTSEGQISQCANYASSNGGGIYNNGYLYLGMSTTDTSNTDYLDEGYGIMRNYASNGGGVYNSNNASVFRCRGDISYNNANQGGAVYLYKDTTFISGTFKQNKARSAGGGIFIYTGKEAKLQGNSDKPFTLEQNFVEKSITSGTTSAGIMGGAISNNGGTVTIEGLTQILNNYVSASCSSNGSSITAMGGAIYNDGNVKINSTTAPVITGNYVQETHSNGGTAVALGGAVYHCGNYVKLSNKATLYDSTASEKHNDVYLASGKTISIEGSLDEDHVAVITPYDWSRGIQYLGVSGSLTALPDGVENKFSFSQDGWDSKLYKITNDNDAAKMDADIYVAGTSGVVKCKNSSGTAYTPSNNTIGNWSHPLQSISQALALLDADHNTIIVDGTVTGAQEISGTITPDDIIITGYVPSGETESAATLYGGSSSTLTVIASGKTVTIKNLTITNGNATTGSGSSLNGGGIYMSEGTVKLSDGAKIYGNSATNYGGGVYVGSGTALYMHGKALIGFDTTTNKRPTTATLGTTEGRAANKAKYGGGIYNDGGSVYIGCNSSGATSTGSGSSLVNYALDTGYGIRQNISSNGSSSSNKMGGGIYHAGGTLIIASGTVSYNSSNGDNGGAIYAAANATIKGGTFTGNYGYSAGAIYIPSGVQVEINGNAVITKNTAYTAGGAIDNHGTLKMSAGTIGGTDADNSAGTAGGAIYCREGATFEMSGSAYIPYGGAKKKNDVTLQTDCKVKVTNNISLPSGVSTAATLDRVAAGKGKVVVDASNGTILSNNVGKFASNNPGFKVGTDGALKLKYTPNTLYVKQVDGSKDTSTKTVIYDSEWNSDTLSYNDSETFPATKFKNIKTALQFITYQATKQDYTIIIDGEVKGQTKLEDDSTYHVTLDAESTCKSLTLQGTSYAQNVNSHKLNGDFGNTAVADGSTLIINTAIPVTISQLDIIGGNTTGNGGGIRIDKPGESTVAHVTIKKTNIHDNTSTITSDLYCGGGGISNDHGILVLDEKTIIYGNTAAKYGGGVFNKGGKVYMCGGSDGAWIGKKDSNIKVRAQSNKTNANRAGINTESVPGKGGGLYSQGTAGGCVYIGYKPPATEGGDPVADSNFNGGFKFNYASNDGGGVYCETGYSGQAFKMYAGYIKQNSADKSGGGVYGALTMEGGNIEDNYAGEYGGGIYANGTLTLNGGTIGTSVSEAAQSSNPDSSRDAATNPKKHSNYAGKGGGGIYMNNGSVASGVTVAYNYAGEVGGGLNINGTSYSDLSYSANTKYNGAGQKGGGIYCNGGGNPKSIGSTMITNKVYNTSGENGGGAIYIASTSTKFELTSSFRITTANSTTVTKGTDDVYVYITSGYNSPGNTTVYGTATYIQIPAAITYNGTSKKIGLTLNTAYESQGRLIFIGDHKEYGATLFKMTDSGRSIGTNGMVY